jgi:RNA polymerase sigma-70 factor (ECF subfamily)
VDLKLLIEQIKRGDESAGAILVSVVAPRLLGYADLIGSDLPEADREEAVEIAIETAIRRIDRYDEARGTFPAWARTFVRHAIEDWRRKNPLGAPTELGPESRLQTDVAVDSEEVSPTGVSGALTALVLTESEPNQLLIRLRFVEQLTHAQIAERLEITEPASRKRLERLLEQMRQRAAEDPDLKRFLEGDEA